MKTRDDLFRIYTEPSDIVQRVTSFFRRIFQIGGTKQRS